MTIEDLAQTIYNAYVRAAERGQPQGTRLPAWPHLTERRRRAWEAAAGAACSALRTRPGALGCITEFPPLELLTRGAPDIMAVPQ